MLKALSFLVTTGISWVAVGAIVGLIGRKGLNLIFYQIISGLFSVAVSIAIAIASPEKVIPPQGVPVSTWIGVVCGGVSCGVFNYIMIQFMGIAMKKGPNSIVWATIQSGLIYPFLMGWLVFGEKMNAYRALGIVLIIASIVLYAARGKADGSNSDAGQSKEKVPVSAWFIPSVLGMLCCGTNQCGGNLPSFLERGQEFPGIFRSLLCSGASLICCICHIMINRSWPKPRPGEIRTIALYTIGLMCISYPVGVLLQYPGLDMLKNLGAGSMGYPIMVASCIIGFFPYGLLVLREKINPLQAIGAVVGVAGIILGCL